MSKHKTPKKPVSEDWHKADIKAALEKAGWTLRALSEHHGYSPSLLKHALQRQYPNGEQKIAEALGLKPAVIWPSRYDTNGDTTCRRGRPAHRKNHLSTHSPAGHVEKAAAI